MIAYNKVFHNDDDDTDNDDDDDELSFFSSLKGLCHEDIAILGQFCAQVIVYILPLAMHKMLL